MRIILTLFAVFIGFSTVLAQEGRFFVPREIRNAYEAGTRSTTGKPGPEYWQNTVDYVINASLEPSTRTISGTVEATYHNNSPEAMNIIVVRLYQDVFKKGGQRQMAVNPEDINEGMSVSNLSVNDQAMDMESRQVNRNGTNMIIQLPAPLASGGTTTIKMDWSYVVPLTLRRTGVYDSSSYHVAYWYPQISVYDDVFGWDLMDYTFQTEFYNNLGNYDVTISAPESFNIWATGVLQNASEIYPDDVLSRYNEAKASEETVHIITDSDLEGYSNKTGTWHYTAEEVSDFAFSVSDHYLWDAAMQKVEDRDVFIGTVFPAGQAEAYAEVTQNQRKAMQHFSEDMPGIPYPYPAFTTFIGLRGGGMEFPMMANNAGPNLGVTVHEMYHTYFPMYVRVNERRFAWMDEGWAQYITDLVIDRYFNENDEPVYSGLVSGTGVMGSITDLPLITSTQFMDGSNYGYASYSLPAFFYGMLHDYLGDEVFTNAYREYIRRWAKKSPTPYDFLYTMEDVSGEDLGWLYNPWFFNYGNADLAIKELNGNKLIVENLGTRPVPLKVDMYYSNGESDMISESADIWKSSKEYSVTINNPDDLAFVMISQGVPDENPDNNLQPSLEEIYAKVNISDDFIGSYALDQFPITMQVEKQGDKLHMQLMQTNFEGFLLPVSENSFKTTNGMMSIQFQREGDQVTGANIQVQGLNLTSKK